MRTCCRTGLALQPQNSASLKEKALLLPFETNQQLLFQWGRLLTSYNQDSSHLWKLEICSALSYQSEVTKVLIMPIIAGKAWASLEKNKPKSNFRLEDPGLPAVSLCVIFRGSLSGRCASVVLTDQLVHPPIQDTVVTAAVGSHASGRKSNAFWY